MAAREGDALFGQGVDEGFQGLAVQRAVGTVQAFESLEHQGQTLQVPQFQHVVLAIDGMGDGMSKIVLFHVGRHLIDVVGHRLHRVMIGLAQAPDEQVDFATVFGKVAGDFLADEDFRMAGQFAERRRWNRDR